MWTAMNMHRFLMAVVLMGTVLANAAAPAGQRTLTLQGCFQEAIQHNLGLQVARYDPLVARNNLSLAYAGYDPTLNFSGQHNDTRTGGGLDSDQRLIPPSESESDQFSTRVSGLLPWGMTYDLAGRAANTSGERGFLDSSTNLLFAPFEESQGFVQARVTQPLLKNAWMDGTRLSVAVAKQQLARSKEAYRQQLIDLITTVENAYYDLVSARENLKVQEKALQLARKLLDENRKRVELGALAPLDEKQAEAEVAAREADLLSAQRTLALNENALKRAITDDFAQWQEVELLPGEALSASLQLFDVQDSWNKGLTLRPDIIQAWSTLEQRDIELKFARNQLFPQLDAVATYGHSASDVAEFAGLFTQYQEGNQPYWSAGAVFAIPLSNTEARARHRNARARVEQSVLTMKDLEQTIMAEIDDAVKFAKVSYRRIAATRAAREYAESALAAEEEKLAQGKSTSFEVLRLQRDLTQARSTEISALTEYNKALAVLAQREGRTLERHRIELGAH
jgi:outer membrane protein TolC